MDEIEKVVNEALANIIDDGYCKPFEPTRKQVDMIHYLAERIMDHDRLNTNNYEFKEFKLTYGFGRHLFLIATVGRKDDEGTMAAILCRNHRHLIIGVKGGIKSLTAPKGKNLGLFNALIHYAH